MDGRLWGVIVDSFDKLLIPGLTVTIPLTLISFVVDWRWPLQLRLSVWRKCR